MRFGTILIAATGFGLRQLSHSLELQGDLAQAPGERLFCHGAALIVLLAAMACFFRVLWVAVRAVSGYRRPACEADLSKVFAGPTARDAPEASEASLPFDAEAAFARYMARNHGEAPTGDSGAPPPGSRFGRKGL